MTFPNPVGPLVLKLEADPTAEEAISGDQDDLTVVGGQGYVPLGKDVAAIGQDFGMARDK